MDIAPAPPTETARIAPITPDAEILRTFVERLLAAAAPDAADTRSASLRLAAAALRLAAVGGPRHLAVIGPTQTGKSTVVNLLLKHPAAEVSPLAGFTVHAQGFTRLPDSQTAAALPDAFIGMRRVRRTDLAREDLNEYSLDVLPADGLSLFSAALETSVVWDTPDFDSLASAEYSRAVFEAIALADAHLLVVSKEKYSDLAVWRILRLIEPLGRPLLIVVNKLTAEAEEPVLRSLASRLSEQCPSLADTPVVALPFTSARAGPIVAGETGGELRASADRLLDGPRPPRLSGIARLARQHWSRWTAPIEAELAAGAEWRRMVDARADELIQSYRRDYLEHPQRYDSLRRATLRVLQLLEVPWLSSTVAQVRGALTWPFRRLATSVADWRESVSRRPPSLPNEEIILRELAEKMLSDLERDSRRRADHAIEGAHVWRAAAASLETRWPALREAFAAEVHALRVAFEPEIESAAQRLHGELQRHPVLLNSLRAGRAATDVASIVIAVKTAGIGWHDVLLAPAMLAVTSFLTEGALGSHMRRVESELKTRQLELVRSRLLSGGGIVDLRDIFSSGGASSFSAADLAAAGDALRRLEADAR